MFSLSIDSIANSAHALTALAAFTSQLAADTPAVLTPDRREALSPLIADTALRLAAQLQLDATIDGDIIAIECDQATRPLAAAMAEVVRNQVLAQIYTPVNPQVAQLWQQSALTALARLTAIVDDLPVSSPEGTAVGTATKITPHYI